MDRSRSEIGKTIAVRLGHRVANALELTAANVGEILAIGTRRRALVEEDRNLELTADARGEGPGKSDAILHRRALERNERNDVGGAHPRVLAAVLRQVYEV